MKYFSIQNNSLVDPTIPDAGSASTLSATIGTGTFINQQGHQMQVQASSGAYLPHDIEAAEDTGNSPGGTSAYQHVELDTYDYGTLMEELSDESGNGDAMEIDAPRPLVYWAVANSNGSYFHQADPVTGDQGQWPIHHKKSDAAHGLESALETYCEGRLQFSAGELLKTFKAMDVGPGPEGGYGMEQVAEMLAKTSIESRYFSRPFYPSGAMLGRAAKAFAELMEKDQMNEAAYLRVDNRIAAYLQNTPHNLLSDKFHVILRQLKKIIADELKPTQPRKLEVDGINQDKIKWLNREIESALYRHADKMALQEKMLASLERHASDQSIGDGRFGKILLSLNTGSEGCHVVAFRIVDGEWHCFHGRRAQPEKIMPKAYVARAMATGADKVGSMEFILPDHQSNSALHSISMECDIRALDSIDAADNSRSDDLRLIVDLPTPQEICNAIKMALHDPTNSLFSKAKQCAAMFQAPYYSSPLSHTSYWRSAPDVQKMVLEKDGTITLKGKPISVAPEYQEIYNEYINGQYENERCVRPGRGTAPGSLIRRSVRGKPNQLGKETIDVSTICKASLKVYKSLPQLSFLRGSGNDSRRALKAACAFALMVQMDGDETTKVKRILNLKRSDVDPANGNLKPYPDMQCDKTKRLLLARYHAVSGKDDDCLLPFHSKSDGTQSSTEQKDAMKRYRTRMKGFLDEAQNAPNPWRNLPG